MAGASSRSTQRCVRWQAMQPRQKPIALSLRLTVSTAWPASCAPRAKAAASASVLLFFRRLAVMMSTFFGMSVAPFRVVFMPRRTARRACP